MIKEKLKLTDAMNTYKKEFKKGYLNLINAHPCCGKTYFIMNEFLNNTNTYYKVCPIDKPYSKRLSKILYVCDTTMLKDSVLKEHEDITDKFGKGSIIDCVSFNKLKKTMSDDNGTIKVITYSALGNLLNEDKIKNMILNSFDIIILDEIQNAFKYCRIHNMKDKDNIEGEYVNVIKSLNEMSTNTLLIGLSGTPNELYRFKNQYGNIVNIRKIFNEHEIDTLYTNNFNPIYSNCIMNQIKKFNYERIKEKNYKIFIATRTIRESNKFKEYFESIGLNAQWLCSVNNKDVVTTEDEEGNIITETIPKMNNEQIELRNYLIEHNRYPNDLDVLIVNHSYETGWNLIDERVQVVFINITNEDEQYQFRHRIRHDVACLCCLWKLYDSDGLILDYGQWNELEEKRFDNTGTRYYIKYISMPKMNKIDDKYLRTKLTKDMKEEIVNRYGIKGLDNKLNWKSVSKDLKELGYNIVNKRGTYILDSEDDIESINNIRKVEDNMDKLEMYLEGLVDKRLFKEDQDILVNTIGLKDSRGRIQKSIKSINAYLEDEFNKQVISKRVKVNGKLTTIWEVSNK